MIGSSALATETVFTTLLSMCGPKDGLVLRTLSRLMLDAWRACETHVVADIRTTIWPVRVTRAHVPRGMVPLSTLPHLHTLIFGPHHSLTRHIDLLIKGLATHSGVLHTLGLGQGLPAHMIALVRQPALRHLHHLRIHQELGFTDLLHLSRSFPSTLTHLDLVNTVCLLPLMTTLVSMLRVSHLALYAILAMPTQRAISGASRTLSTLRLHALDPRISHRELVAAIHGTVIVVGPRIHDRWDWSWGWSECHLTTT